MGKKGQGVLKLLRLSFHHLRTIAICSGLEGRFGKIGSGAVPPPPIRGIYCFLWWGIRLIFSVLFRNLRYFAL